MPNRTLRAFLIAPLGAYIVIYIATAVYLRQAILLIAPVAWIFGAVVGLPVLYAAAVLMALPLHWMLERLQFKELPYYMAAALVPTVIATWVWSEIIRYGPIPLFRDFPATVMLTIPAGLVGGAVFWRIAVR